MSRIYTTILIGLALLMAVFIVIGIVYIGFYPIVDFSGTPSSARGQGFFVNSLGFISLCLILISLLFVSIKKMDGNERVYNGTYRLYRSVFARLDTGIMVLDPEKRIKYLNPACRKLLGRKNPDESFEGLAYFDVIHPVLSPIAEKLAAAIDSGESFSREFRVFLVDGIRCLQCDVNTFIDEDLGPIHVVALVDKSGEDEIKRQLSTQLEETHRYTVSKDNFFANMSHEIRTPINAILGMTYFVKNLTTDPRGLEYVQKIENASELLLGVVNDILDFSKMQEHKFTLKPENFNLTDLKKILSDLFGLKAEQKGLVLTIDFDCPDSFTVLGDQFRLTQIFMNLVSNAIKFTDVGFVSVFLNHEIIGNEIILRCTVRDTGCGLTEEDGFKLFTDFAQFGKVLVKNHEGTGLGLAICKRLVELMDGVIWVDSTPGAGSSFHFVVVLKKTETASPGLLTESLPRIERKTGRVLVVEDNEINAEIAGTLLAEIGCTAEYAFDGREAVENCGSRPPDYYDLILMDIHMPRLNGYDAARILKKEQNITCPVIAVSATSENTGVLEANRDVIAGYMLKPYNPDVFKALFGTGTGT